MARLAVLVGLILVTVDLALCQRGGDSGRGGRGGGRGGPGRGGPNDLERGPGGRPNDQYLESNPNPENKLAREKLYKYPAMKHVRPVMSKDDTVPLNVSYTFARLVEFDEVNHYATMTGWLSQMWMDAFLTWDAYSVDCDDYCGVNQLRVSPDAIWRPDLRDYNAVREDTAQDEIVMVAYPNGLVANIPPTRHRVGCHEQSGDADNYCEVGDFHCKLVFGTWTYNKNEVEVHLGSTWTPSGLDMDHYQRHPRWELYNEGATLENKVYEKWGNVQYPKIDFEFCLRDTQN